MGNSLSPIAGTLNFLAEANDPSLAPSTPFQISTSLVQGSSSLVAAPDDAA